MSFIFNNNTEWWFMRRGGLELIESLQLNLNRHQINQFLNSFHLIFNNEWFNSIKEAHKNRFLNLYFNFIGGPYTIIKILRLGECLYHLRDKIKTRKEIIARLRNRREFQSTALELEIASCFVQAGYDLDIYPQIESGRNPEGKITIEGKDVYYEVARQDSLDNGRIRQSFIDEIYSYLRNYRQISGEIKLKPSQKTLEEKIDDLFLIFDENLDIALSEDLPFIFENDDFNIHLMTNEINSSINITGWVLNRKKIIQNWVKRILDKGDQLPPNEGGVIIGSSSRLWDPTDFDYAIEQIQSELRYGSHKRISGIIFCSKRMEGVPVLQSDKLEFIKVLPVPLINTNTNVDITDKILIMRKALFDFPVWI